MSIDKEFLKNNWIFIIAFVCVAILFTTNIYNNRGWEKMDECISWYAYSPNNCTSGYLTNCTDVKVIGNAWEQGCICIDDNSIGHHRRCFDKIEIRRYSGKWEE